MTDKTQMPDIQDKMPVHAAAPVKKNAFGKLADKIKKYNELRERNSEKYKLLNAFLLVLFPIFIACMAEINQFKTLDPFMLFAAQRPTVLAFNFIASGVIFVLLLAAFRKGWVAVLTQSLMYMALSITELFKYGTNGNHLILSDMKLVKSVKSLKSFAYIRITPRLIIYCIIVFLFFAVVFHLNPKLPRHKGFKRVIAASCSAILCLAIVIFPPFYKPVYKLFKLDTTAASNAFLLNEKFENNSFLAFLIETASENFSKRLRKPDNYTEDYIGNIISVPVDTSENFNGGTKPNVIVIMSESFADFRVFDELNIPDSYYAGFDKACAEGKSGKIITPTYASWTVRAEFELLFGLPVRGINTPNMPQRELADRPQPAFAQYYKSWGYQTAYVHPFQGGFYNRDKIYRNFGFDKMIFHDDIDEVSDFTVDVEHFGTYVDDGSDFAQLADLIKTTKEPVYVHTTTMQNHQPYDQGEDPTDEIGNYLTWIGHTCDRLTVFLDELRSIDEPTIVFFVGDHFPSLRGETSVYNQLNLTGENCSVLYEQTYFLWSNYGADFSSVPDTPFSFFYVPYIIADVIDAPHDAFMEKMDGFLETVPVYSTDYNDGTPDNEELNVLTYDRVIGDILSPSPIPTEDLD